MTSSSKAFLPINDDLRETMNLQGILLKFSRVDNPNRVFSFLELFSNHTPSEVIIFRALVVVHWTAALSYTYTSKEMR